MVEVVWDKDLVGKAGERGAVGEGGQWPRNGELRENGGAWEGAMCIGGKLRLAKESASKGQSKETCSRMGLRKNRAEGPGHKSTSWAGSKIGLSLCPPLQLQSENLGLSILCLLNGTAQPTEPLCSWRAEISFLGPCLLPNLTEGTWCRAHRQTVTAFGTSSVWEKTKVCLKISLL